MKRICVYAGSKPGKNPDYVSAARAVGRTLAGRGIGIVYGGGCNGMMGAFADAVLDAGGEAIGVIPRKLTEIETPHDHLTELRLVDTMHERKALMADLADGFIILPGGFGTLEETLETITWAQLGIHEKPIGLLNVAGYYDPLLSLFAHAQEQEFILKEQFGLFIAESDPDRLLDKMAAYSPPALSGWKARKEIL